MMFKKAISKSGRKLLKAIKKLSTPKKFQEQKQKQKQQQLNNETRPSISSSLPSLDAKSIDTFVTYVADNSYNLAEEYYSSYCCCCHCDESSENQRNENLENEMMC